MKRSDISDEAVCAAYTAAKARSDVFADGVLAERFPEAPAKVIYAAMERAHARGLVEYGVSLRAGWLTDKGVEMGGKREDAA